jgi:hypothetical protein
MASKYVLTAVELKAVLEKIEAEGVVTLDAYPVNKYFIGDDADPVTMTDVQQFDVATSLTDIASMSDSLPLFTIDKGLADTVGITESIDFFVTTIREVADAVSMVEVAGILFEHGGFTDSMSVSEAISVQAEPNPSETLTIGDAPVTVMTLQKADSVSVGDAPVLVISKAFTDGIAIDDQSELETLSDIAKQNVFSVLESHAINVDSVLSDTTNLSESAVLALSTVESDSISMGDDSVELRLNGFLVGAESSVLNAQSLNEFTLNS